MMLSELIDILGRTLADRGDLPVEWACYCEGIGGDDISVSVFNREEVLIGDEDHRIATDPRHERRT